jgi:hypothetical protein
MATQFDNYQTMLKEQKLQTDLMFDQSNIMLHIGESLNGLQDEMIAIRELNLQGLAIQQEMLNRERLQSYMEEFIFNTQKMVSVFNDTNCEHSQSGKYFSLKGILETVQQLRLGTALVRGRENKETFETTMNDVRKLTVLLEKDSEVQEAINWTKIEQKRIDDEQRKQKAEQDRIAAEKESRLKLLLKDIEELETKKQSFKFVDWYKETFDNYLNQKPPFDKIKVFSSLHPMLVQIILWAPLPFGLYGCVWIPFMFSRAKKKYVLKMNPSIDLEISKIRQEISEL